jgi:hypothetical protein
VNIRNEPTEAGESVKRTPPAQGIAADMTLPQLEAATDFERWLEAAQARSSMASAAHAPEQPKDAAGDPASDSEVGELESIEGDARSTLPAWAAQSFHPSMPAADTPQPSAPQPLSPAWAEVAASIERLLISQTTGPHVGAAAMFRLAPDVLRETSAALSRVEGGWLLRIDSSDPRLRFDAGRHEHALRERFALGGLGELTIEQGELPNLAV